MHLGPVTQPNTEAESSDRKAYFYFVVPDATLRHRIQSDLLCFALLAALARNPALQAEVTHSIGPSRLAVGWCTHKYTMTASGAGLQSAKGSGGRTHCYLMAFPHVPDDNRGVHLADIYNTTMWFNGTYPSGQFSCASSRLLLSWGRSLPSDFLDHARQIWDCFPSQV